VLDAVEPSAGIFLTDWVHVPTGSAALTRSTLLYRAVRPRDRSAEKFDNAAAAARLDTRLVLTPLLEEEPVELPRGRALIAQRAHPIRVHRARAVAALAADDDPVENAA
jgi:hypothetical protein